MSYYRPLEEIKALLIRCCVIKKRYKISFIEILKIKFDLWKRERNFNMKKPTMNEDIQEFEIFLLTHSGRLIKIDWIKSTEDYNHYIFNLHHYIPRHDFNKNRKWYEDRGIKQKLILMPITTHEAVHNIGIKTYSDEEFKTRFKISRRALIFNKKYSEY